MTTRTRRRIDGDVQDRIVELALEKGWGPTQIYKDLEEDSRFTGRVPTVRTVQRIANEVTVPDPSGPWSLAESEGDDGRLLLEVLATVVRRSGGLRRFTKDEAAWILKIRRAAPTIDPWLAWVVAQFYRLKEVHHGDSVDLDLFLAFAPWDGETAREAYRNAVTAGRVPPFPGPAFLWESPENLPRPGSESAHSDYTQVDSPTYPKTKRLVPRSQNE